MSGRAYSMKEMKVIVEYLVQRKAYGEVKGRKMWMDLANSPLTIRTWQSLKETFIKRILPDIHNPYYKLTVDQIRSFREGCDTEAKEKNKLEIVSVGDSNEDSNSNTNAEKQVENEQPSTSHENNGEAKSGEDVTCSKVDNRNRDSVDTIILPTCYETAEDLQRVLESPNNDKDPHSNQLSPPHKTLKDCITYSEPLSVMLQEVLHDFGTDNESDDEMKMQIVETHLGSKLENEQTETNIPDVDLEPIVILDTEDMLANNKDQEPEERAEDHPEDATNTEQPKVSSLKLKKSNGGYEIDNKRNSEASKADERVSSEVEPANQTTEDVPENSENQSNHADEKKDKEQPNHEKSSSEKCFPSQSTTADSILPNNQEALKKSESNASPNKKQAESEIPIQSSEQPKETVKNTSKKGKSRKRAISQDVTSTTQIIKKPLISKKTSKDKAVSDTDTIKKNLIEKTSKSDLAKMAKQIEKDNTKSDKSNKKGEKVSENIVENTISAPQEESHSMTDLSQSNPCLQSVSLFEEQFKKSSYVTSDENEVVPVENTDKDVANKNKDVENKNKDVENKNKDVENRNKDVQNNKKDNNSKKDSINDVVILKSHSDSESELEEAAKKSKKYDSRVSKPQREKVLANVFGFSSGAVGKKRKKSINYRKHHYHTTRHQSSGESSDWTSESDSEEYVSPPRGRRNRQTRKYLKPQSARILSLEEEGGLFVMYGKKIYPLVKDGKIMKNYLTYLPESDPEDEESYWKTKYIEEKQRAEELKKLVVENEQKHFRKSPILLPKPSRHISNEDERRSPVKRDTTKHNDPELMPVAAKENTDEENNKGKTLKITFAKNNQEVHVEGHWSNIHPVLAEVVQIFNNDNEARKALSNGAAASKQLSDASSDKSVAIVPIYNKEAHEKINRLEAEIFKEIQRRDREEQELDISSSSAEEEQPGATNVTKRKRGIRIRSSSSRSSKEPASTSRSPKRQKTETTETDTKTNDIKTTEKANEIANNETPDNVEKPVEKRTSRTRQKSSGKPDASDVKPSKAVEESARKSGGKSQEKTDKSKDTPGTSKSIIATRAQTRTPKKDEGTPKSIKPTRQSKTSLPESVSSAQVDDDEIRYMFPPKKSGRKPIVTAGKKDKRYPDEKTKIYFSPPNLSLQSESTQGYQDSDISPPKAIARRKRKLSLTTALSKIRHRTYRNKRKSYPLIADDISSDSSSSIRIVAQIPSENSSKSDAYRSDSYQLLFPQSRNVFRPLERIEETCPNNTLDENHNNSDVLDAFKEAIDRNIDNRFASSSNCHTDIGNSSSISLPLSPELSIVENLSISKEMLNSAEKHPTLNETHANHMLNSDIQNKFTMSQVDVSMPLMQQECNLQRSFFRVIKIENSDDNMGTGIPESFLNDNYTMNVDAPTLSESLDTRLKNLLLESAKKMSLDSTEQFHDNVPTVPKPKSGKRCSTPRKKKEVQKKKLKLTHTVVEEERTESCSFSGRKSCPPSIRLITEDNVLKENVDANINEETDINKKGKGRKKKDVIKVKILRPRSKTRKELTPKKSEVNPVHDSGIINDAESLVSSREVDDSIDLIHNHSETCLHVNECMADSVEFIENPSKSIISLNADSSSNERSSNDLTVFKDCEVLGADMFCQNAQDCANINEPQVPTKLQTQNSGETVYHSPILSDTSLITEDLSDECNPLTKWYLLSDEETQIADAHPHSSGFGSNLKQIFPVTCAVPDLSTITERSNENSRKPTLDSDTSTRQDLSNSMF